MGSNSILNGVKTYILVQFDLWKNQNLRMHISSKSIFKIFVRWKCVREHVIVQKCSGSPYLWLKFVGYWYHNGIENKFQFRICRLFRNGNIYIVTKTSSTATLTIILYAADIISMYLFNTTWWTVCIFFVNGDMKNVLIRIKNILSPRSLKFWYREYQNFYLWMHISFL